MGTRTVFVAHMLALGFNDTADEATLNSSVRYELIQSLAKCFVVICAGFIASKLKLLNDTEAKGLTNFVRQFSLPSLMFVTLATVKINHINWAIMKCIVLAKTIIFVSVLCITLLVTKPMSIGKAGLYSIFSIQSNDLCVGLPIIESLYKDYQLEFSHYLYFLAIVQYLILNPVGFFLMHLQGEIELNTGPKYSAKNLFVTFLKSSLLNPIIVMTILGIFSNFCFNQKLPTLIYDSLSIFGASFSAIALFSLGHSLVGKLSLVGNTSFATSTLLIITKILMLPIISRMLLFWYPEISGKSIYENFVLIYGTIPTAPTVYIFATQFNMETDIVASGMAVSTLVSAPLMLLFGGMIQKDNTTVFHYPNDRNTTITYSSIVSILSSLWVIFIFWKSKSIKSITHCMSIFIFLSQFLTAIGGMLHSTAGQSKSLFYFQYVFSVGGAYSSRAWTASLAFVLALSSWKGLCYSLSFINYIMVFVCTTSFLLVLFLGILIYQDQMESEIDSDIYFTNLECRLNVTILVICIIVILYCLIVQQTRTNQNNREECETTESFFINEISTSSQFLLKKKKLYENVVDDKEDIEISEIEDLECSPCIVTKDLKLKTFPLFCQLNSKCSKTRQKQCKEIILKYKSSLHTLVQRKDKTEYSQDGHQIVEHTTFVILLFTMMIFSFAINLWRLLKNGKSLLNAELEHLDLILNYGQGIISFAVFGFNKELVINLCVQVCQSWGRFYHGY